MKGVHVLQVLPKIDFTGATVNEGEIGRVRPRDYYFE